MSIKTEVVCKCDDCGEEKVSDTKGIHTDWARVSVAVMEYDIDDGWCESRYNTKEVCLACTKKYKA